MLALVDAMLSTGCGNNAYALLHAEVCVQARTCVPSTLLLQVFQKQMAVQGAHLLALRQQPEVVLLPGVQDSWREEGLGVGAEAELGDGVAHAVQQGAVQSACTAMLW